MMGNGWGMGMVGWSFMALFALLLIGLVVWAVFALTPAARAGNGPERPEDPVEILSRRFARGEIGAEEYRQARDELAPPQRRGQRPV